MCEERYVVKDPGNMRNERKTFGTFDAEGLLHCMRVVDLSKTFPELFVLL